MLKGTIFLFFPLCCVSAEKHELPLLFTVAQEDKQQTTALVQFHTPDLSLTSLQQQQQLREALVELLV